MNVQITSILQRSAAPNSGRYARSYGVNDYYWGDKNVSFPLGHIQAAGGVLQDALFAESPPVLSLISKLIPSFGIKRLASRTVAWWAMTEVLPDQENRVWLNKEQIRINYLHNNREAHDRLVYRWIDTLKSVEADPYTKVVNQSPFIPAVKPLSALWALPAAPAAWVRIPPHPLWTQPESAMNSITSTSPTAVFSRVAQASGRG